MKIIRTTPNDSGAYPGIQAGTFRAIPDGYARWPDDLDTAEFYAHNGFVTLTIEDVAIEVSPGVCDVERTVTAVTPNLEAWEAWKEEEAAKPTPEPEPTPQDDTDAMLVDHEYRLTLLELGLNETEVI